MNILVTGSRGFLGQRVTLALVRRAQRVRALDLPRSAALPHVEAVSGVEERAVDLCGTQDLVPTCEGIDLVIHLAARMSGEPAAIVATAVEGTRRLLEAMSKARVPRLVLASSLSVYDWSTGATRLNEDSPLESRPERRDAYTIAKLEQERLSRELCSEFGVGLCVLRPGILWGRGHEYPATLGQRLGRLHFPIGQARQLSAVHVENCADAFAAVASSPEPALGTFNLLDHPEVSVARFVHDYVREPGRRGLVVPVPYRAIFALVRGLDRLVPASLERKLPSFLGPARFAARFAPVVVEAGRLREAISWSPPLGYAECRELTY